MGTKRKDKDTAILDRDAAYRAMLPPTKELAREFSSLLVKNAQVDILTYYDLGCRLITVLGDRTQYGSNALSLLAAHMGESERNLYDWRNLAVDFPNHDGRAYIAVKSNRQTKHGMRLSISHWVHLRRLHDRDEQDKMLERIYDEDMSALELRDVIQAIAPIRKKNQPRGRVKKFGQPSSPAAGLRRFAGFANKLVRYIPLLNEFVFEALKESPVTDMEVKKDISLMASSALEHIGKLIEDFGSVSEELQRLIIKTEPRKPRPAKSTAS